MRDTRIQGELLKSLSQQKRRNSVTGGRISTSIVVRNSEIFSYSLETYKTDLFQVTQCRPSAHARIKQEA